MELTPYKAPPPSVAEEEDFTSTQIASSLFSRHLYYMYKQWQGGIDNAQEAEHYESREAWVKVRDLVHKNVSGGLPTPKEYCAFLSRNKAKINDYFLPRKDVEVDTQIDGVPTLARATICDHKMHPSYPDPAPELCPRCAMRECKWMLDGICRAWQVLGGPGRVPDTPDGAKMYFIVKRIWHVEKKRWANLVHKCEHYSALEKQWDERARDLSPRARRAIAETQSCLGALDFARAHVPFLAAGWDLGFVPRKRGINARTALSKLELQQAPDVNEMPSSPPCLPPSVTDEPSSNDQADSEETAAQLPQQQHQTSPTPRSTPLEPPNSPSSLPFTANGPHPFSSSSLPSPPRRRRVTFPTDMIDPPSRPAYHYKRKCSLYQPGRHDCAPNSEWADTSFMNSTWYNDSGGTENWETAVELEKIGQSIEEAESVEHEGSDTNGVDEAVCDMEEGEEDKSAPDTEGEEHTDHEPPFRVWQDTEEDLDPQAGLAVWNPVPPVGYDAFPGKSDSALALDGHAWDSAVLQSEDEAMRIQEKGIQVEDEETQSEAEEIHTENGDVGTKSPATAAVIDDDDDDDDNSC